MNIYIIQGYSGEWDVACEWIVSIHISKELAESKLGKLEKYVEETRKIVFDNYRDRQLYLKETSPDPEIQWNPDGVFYEVLEFPVEEE